MSDTLLALNCSYVVFHHFLSLLNGLAAHLDSLSWNTMYRIRQGTLPREQNKRKPQNQWFAFDIHLPNF